MTVQGDWKQVRDDHGNEFGMTYRVILNEIERNEESAINN